MKQSTESKHYNWLMGADMYLAASILLCDEMLKSYQSPIRSLNNDEQINKRCGFTSANPDYEMLMPVVFNLKHGVELYVKALIMRVNKSSEYPQSHDLVALLNCLILEMRSNNQHKIDLQILDKDLRNIIEKYYFGLYAFATERIWPDVYNEAERYPEHRNTNCYKIDELYKIDMNSLLVEIKRDCISIQKCLREDILKKLRGRVPKTMKQRHWKVNKKILKH